MSAASLSRTRPATLWIGPRLSVIEQLCLASFVRHGMAPILFSYEPVDGVPDGVEVLDAKEILPTERVFLNNERQSYAPFSDVFRYQMLRDTEYYWVDADIYLCRPFPTESDYLFGTAQSFVSNCVLALPQGSPTLAALCAAAEEPSVDFPWIARFRERMVTRTQADGSIKVGDLPYKALGPLALEWLLRHHGEAEHAHGKALHAAIDPRHVLRFWRRARQLVRKTNPYAIHLYASEQYKQIQTFEDQRVPEDSYLAHLLRTNGLGLELYAD